MAFHVFLVDDDVGIQKALYRLLKAAGYEPRTYGTARDFLADYSATQPGCIILDLNLPEVDGLELQQKLASAEADQPVIFVSGTGDVPTSVRAMKAGAIDFLTKPVQRHDLIAAIERAREQVERTRQVKEERAVWEERMARLTPREREVMGYVVAGRLNKQIAAELGTVEKTIKVHRSRIMEKLGLRSVADLVRFAERGGVRPRI